MSDFITDVERQYELYCKIAEEHGFIDLGAKKNGFRCTTKSNEFNAGWIAFVGAVAAVRDEQQTIIDDLKAQLNNMEACYIEKKKRVDELEGALNEVKEWKSHPVGYETSFGSWGVRDFYRGLAEKALRGES